MDDGFVITLIKKIIEVFEAENVPTGELKGEITTFDYGGLPPGYGSSEFPVVYIMVDSSRHPEMRAAQGTEEAYDDQINLLINVYCYFLERGHQKAMVEAANLFEAVKKVCHENKQWDGLVYTSEFAEEEDAGWGTVPWGRADYLVYGISAPMRCKRRSM